MPNSTYTSRFQEGVVYIELIMAHQCGMLTRYLDAIDSLDLLHALARDHACYLGAAHVKQFLHAEPFGRLHDSAVQHPAINLSHQCVM